MEPVSSEDAPEGAGAAAAPDVPAAGEGTDAAATEHAAAEAANGTTDHATEAPAAAAETPAPALEEPPAVAPTPEEAATPAPASAPIPASAAPAPAPAAPAPGSDTPGVEGPAAPPPTPAAAAAPVAAAATPSAAGGASAMELATPPPAASKAVTAVPASAPAAVNAAPTPRRGSAPAMLTAFCVQCAVCFKWRKVPTLEEYEGIRARISQTPFVCEQARRWKPKSSCSDPPDMQQDGKLLWAMDRPDIPVPPAGWRRRIVVRGGTSNKFSDVYYHAPDGKTLRSSKEVEKYLAEHPECSATIKQFSFTSPRPLNPPAKVSGGATGTPEPVAGTKRPGEALPAVDASAKKKA